MLASAGVPYTGEGEVGVGLLGVLEVLVQEARVGPVKAQAHVQLLGISGGAALLAGGVVGGAAGEGVGQLLQLLGGFGGRYLRLGPVGSANLVGNPPSHPPVMQSAVEASCPQ